MELVDFRPIIAMLHTLDENMYHPILFYASPPPSGGPRYKSKGHHTQGFKSYDKAIEFAKTELTEFAKKYFGDPRFCSEHLLWDGKGIPALVIYFKVEGETATPLF